MTSDRTSGTLGGRGLALLGLFLVVAGTVGYFVLVSRFGAWLPSARNDAVPNWILVAIGLLLAVLAVRRPSGGRTAKILLGIDAVLAALFAFFLYAGSVVPTATGPAIGAPAPDFALADQSGAQVRLADLRGAPVLLVFYRGHW